MNKFINNKGFVLVETLVVSVFVVTVFTFLYINVLPLIGSYEEEVNYDSIDTKYIGNLARNNLKRYLSNDEAVGEAIASMKNDLYRDILYIEINCDKKINNIPIFGNQGEDNYAQCKEFMSLANVEHIYITKYNLSDIKKAIVNNTNTSVNNLSSQTKEYIKFLPTYENIPSNAEYRLIIALRDSYNNKELYYGTIELDF